MRPTSECSKRHFMQGIGATALATWSGRAFAAPKTAIRVRFGIVTDCHYAEIPTKIGRYYRESNQKLEECVGEMNRQAVDFLIELGDFKDQGATPAEALTFLKEIERVFSAFKGPRYHVLGNHDMDCISKPQFMAHIQNAEIPKSETYYSFNVRGVHFVVLDANFRSDGTGYDSGNFDWREAVVPASQLQWLSKDLASTSFPTIVFVHQLLDADEGPVYVRNAADVRSVLEHSQRVLAVFQGHHHAGSYRQVNGLHYYTLKAVIDGSGPENNAYAIVSVHDDGSVSVQGMRRAISQKLPVA